MAHATQATASNGSLAAFYKYSKHLLDFKYPMY